MKRLNSNLDIVQKLRTMKYSISRIENSYIENSYIEKDLANRIKSSIYNHLYNYVLNNIYLELKRRNTS